MPIRKSHSNTTQPDWLETLENSETNKSTNPEAMSTNRNRWPIEKPLNKKWNSKMNEIIQFNPIRLTWKSIFAITSHWGWFSDRNSLMTLVKISFGGTRSRIIWHKTLPNISPVHGVVNLIRWNRMSMRSVDCSMTSGSSWTIPFEFSVFFSWSFEPVFR